MAPFYEDEGRHALALTAFVGNHTVASAASAAVGRISGERGCSRLRQRLPQAVRWTRPYFA